jgi:hypothetical protein
MPYNIDIHANQYSQEDKACYCIIWQVKYPYRPEEEQLFKYIKDNPKNSCYSCCQACVKRAGGKYNSDG